MESPSFTLPRTWFYWMFRFPPTQSVQLGSIVSQVQRAVSKILLILFRIRFFAQDPQEARSFILLVGRFSFGFHRFQDLGWRLLEFRVKRVRS